MTKLRLSVLYVCSRASLVNQDRKTHQGHRVKIRDSTRDANIDGVMEFTNSLESPFVELIMDITKNDPHIFTFCSNKEHDMLKMMKT